MARSPLIIAVAVLALVLQACGAQSRSAATGQCGEYPRLAPPGSAVPTPGVASSPPSAASATTESVVVIGVWSTCFRPETTTARPGQLIQWQAIEAGIAPELVLEDGTSLGLVRHVLEFRFGQPGTYRYHVRNSAQVTATVIVR